MGGGVSGVFFFRRKAEYEISRGLVGSEVFIRDSPEEGQLRSEADMFPDLDPPVRRDREISAGVEGYFWGPSAVKLDGQGHLYVADSLRHRLQVYQVN